MRSWTLARASRAIGISARPSGTDGGFGWWTRAGWCRAPTTSSTVRSGPRSRRRWPRAMSCCSSSTSRRGCIPRTWRSPSICAKYDARRDRYPAQLSGAHPRVHRHRGTAQAQQGRGRHRVLRDTPDLTGDRARRRVRPGRGCEGRDARPGPEDRQRRLGTGRRDHSRREQVGSDRGEGDEHRGAGPAGGGGAGALPAVHPVSVPVREDRPAGAEAPRTHPGGRGRAHQTRAHGGGQPGARSPRGPAAAAAARGGVGTVALRVADRHGATAVRYRVQSPRGDPGGVHALPRERLPGGVAVHRLPAEPQAPPQARDRPSMNDFGLAVMLALAYLIGATPTSYIAGRPGKRIDLREHGSNNLGATNVYRVLGWKYAIPVGVIDMGKGALPVAILGPWSHGPAWVTGAVGLGAVLRHMFSPDVRFRRGQGVAAAAR